MIKFIDAVKIKNSSCATCNSVIYQLPYKLDNSIAEYLSRFGKPMYPLKAVRLLRIDTDDGFHIEGKIGSKIIKFVMPRKFKEQKTIPKKKEFEICLAEWLSKVLDIPIIIAEQEK